MLVLLMAFCAAGAVFLIGVGLYSEFQDLWSHPGHHSFPEHSHHFKP